MDIVKGFQVKQPDGSYIFIPENELYKNGAGVSQIEKQTVLSWISAKKMSSDEIKKGIPSS
ncbi:hypothetical protein NDS46_30050 (plasmid) [Paenibacillus thiaminolyticus]|uniref:hypothetical protein n=1 Tax=Paenibacillus thiaminolyticus TaxID=49283 RepID=UPI002330A516|nr:hypothetical protein [Paenibacillus thiaminolyticus]WCF11590.1 hypothetical protein NDS46_30050 [Paenibacillus thiaminolyticus]